MNKTRDFIKKLIVCASILAIFLPIPFSFGATFCVSNATELQDALDTAESNGEDDTIQIVQGTYNGNFIYGATEANSLTIEGGYAEGCSSRTIEPANTILDGGGTDMVLALVSQGPAEFTVEGLTLQNGNASTVDYGGGLYAKTEEGNVILTNNTFNGNTAYACGGAYISGSATLTNNTFNGNAAEEGSGGGAYIDGDIATLISNTFTWNTARHGGGVFIDVCDYGDVHH